MFSHNGSRAGRGIALATTLLLIVGFCSTLLQPASNVLAQAVPHQQRLPTTLSNKQVHPGSVLVAFRTPVQASGHHMMGNGRTVAASGDLSNINAILDGLHAKEVRHLFTNIPAATLNAARAKAVAATGAYVTDFTQVYQVIFDQSINDGEAVNRLATSALISSAMPDWIFTAPAHESGVSAAPAASIAAARAAVAARSAHSQGLLDLPPNYGYIADGQSYHDAASNNVTGAWAMINDKFHKQPGQGEVVTNISLGTIDDTSTVLENGQRFLEQRGFPKIPVWLSSCNLTPEGNCDVLLDPTATNTEDGQGDLLEVLLDFSVMAPPPRGDPRVPNPQAPDQTGEILGAAYGADYRLINPLENTTPNFFAAFLGGAFLQDPPPSVITASIGSGFGIGGFSDYFFEQSGLIHDAVSLVVNGGNIFVTISAGDGQTETSVAMNPNGITGPTNVTNDPATLVDIDDPNLWGNPDYSYGLTVEPENVIDSGANDAGGNNLNDIFNNSPWNFGLDPKNRHDQHTTETRWTGQQNFHSGNGSRVNIAAPADNVLMLTQVEDANGIPVNPVDVFPRLIGGTSASSPEIAAAAAVVRQTSKLLGHPLTARQTRDLLVATGHDNRIPNFDLNNTNVGQVLDLTRAVTALFDRSGVKGKTTFVRMTVADRKGLSPGADFRSLFWSDTPQDPSAGTATIDLSQGLSANSSRTLEQIAATGDNLTAPITFAVDAAYLPSSAHFDWSLALGNHHTNVPNNWYDDSRPYLRLLPSEIFGLLGQPVTARFDRTVQVTAQSRGESITMRVTFKGQPNATFTHAVPPSFLPVFRPHNTSDKMTLFYDLRGVRASNGGTVDGGVLIVSDIDRAVPQAFPDNDLDAHGFKKTLHGLFGAITISAAELPHGVGTYGIAIRGTKHGAEVASSTSAWLPLRYAPRRQIIPATPKVLAEDGFGGDIPRFYDIVDIEPGGSSVFQVTYDVRNVPGAANTLIEFSAPTHDFAGALFFSGNFGPDNSFVNNFTNPNGDRLDGGNNFGQPGSAAHVIVAGKSGVATLDGQTVGLSIPTANCDSTYQVRVFALDSHGQIVGIASNPSVFSYADFSRAICFG